MNHTEERCRTFHAAKELSFFTMSVSVILLISTTTLNGLIIVVFIRNKKMLHKSMYYKILLNISLADFLTGLISDTMSISFHTKEGLMITISEGEVILLHCSLFLINTASVLNLGIFCIDRAILLFKPLTFRYGLTDWQTVCLFVTPWCLAAGLITPYFYIGYIRYLKIFCFAAVTLTCVCLITLTITYRIHLSLYTPTIKEIAPREVANTQGGGRMWGSSSTCVTDDVGGLGEDTKEEKKISWLVGEASSCDDDQQYDKETFETGKEMEKATGTDHKLALPYFTRNRVDSKQNIISTESAMKEMNRNVSYLETNNTRCAATEKRVNKTFITMLLVYLGTYLPSAIMTVYVNTCTSSCSCTLVHALRDFIFLAILSSALWRPLNFILRLNTLKNELKFLMKSFRLSCERMVRGISRSTKNDFRVNFSNECIVNSEKSTAINFQYIR